MMTAPASGGLCQREAGGQSVCAYVIAATRTVNQVGKLIFLQLSISSLKDVVFFLSNVYASTSKGEALCGQLSICPHNADRDINLSKIIGV